MIWLRGSHSFALTMDDGAFDTIDMARMGTGNKKFDKAVCRHAIGANPNSSACGQAVDTNVVIQKGHVIEGEIHCIVPLPINYAKLMDAREKSGLVDSIVLSKAAIAATNGMAKFPNDDFAHKQEQMYGARPKVWGIFTCENLDPNTGAVCEDVPQLSLQSFVNKYVNSTGPINMLLIDTEGSDFDVLFGAGDVLDRTEYLEFEYHEVGSWSNYHIMDAVNLLDQKQFTCYWLGDEELWRITGCYIGYYDLIHQWSNVGCVHRSQKELASVMETAFQETLQKY